jgi:hypothetical protein
MFPDLSLRILFIAGVVNTRYGSFRSSAVCEAFQAMGYASFSICITYVPSIILLISIANIQQSLPQIAPNLIC